MAGFAAPELIAAKRDGAVLSDEQIAWMLDSYVAGTVADEQMSAMLMAIFFQGLTTGELDRWTEVMIASGERLDLSGLSRPTVDKHSTGGVGDKISLILAPLVAACGAAVPQLSGRGLGHTGGTLDKLESIPGWRAVLSNEEIVEQLESVGCVICAAGDGLAPADRKLYALRDVTATVESIPLISASIMSKKIAEGTSSLVLDVKVGTGAFMQDYDRARLLAETMVAIGERHHVKTTALLTQMSTPLGRMVGNGLEVTESVEVLQGRGPQDVIDLTVALAEAMVSHCGITTDVAAKLQDGSAYEVYRQMISAQGGDPDATMPEAPCRTEITATRSGVVTKVDARDVGVAAWRLGAGRARKEDPVSIAAGVECCVRPGDEVRAGDVVFILHADDEAHLELGRSTIAPAVEVSDSAPGISPLIFGQVG